MRTINGHNIMPHSIQRIGKGYKIGMVDGGVLVIERFEFVRRSKWGGLEMLLFGSLNGGVKQAYQIAMFVSDGLTRQWDIVGVGVLECWFDGDNRARFNIGGKEFVDIVRRSDLLAILRERDGKG